MSPEKDGNPQDWPEPIRRLFIRANASSVAGTLSEEGSSIIFKGLNDSAVDSLNEIAMNPKTISIEKEGRQKNPKISRPALTAQILQDYSATHIESHVSILEQILEKPRILMSEKDRLQLAQSSALFDFWNGVFFAVTPIFSAEEELAGDTEKNTIEGLAKIEGQIPLDIDTSAETDFFLNRRKTGLDFAELLKEEPTGKRLIHVSIENAIATRELIGLMVFMDFTYMAEGVKFAEKAYNAIYPLTEKV